MPGVAFIAASKMGWFPFPVVKVFADGQGLIYQERHNYGRVRCISSSHQLWQGAVQRFFPTSRECRWKILTAVFQPGEVLIRYAGFACQLLLGKIFLIAQVADKAAQNGLCIHFAYS